MHRAHHLAEAGPAGPVLRPAAPDGGGGGWPRGLPVLRFRVGQPRPLVRGEVGVLHLAEEVSLALLELGPP